MYPYTNQLPSSKDEVKVLKCQKIELALLHGLLSVMCAPRKGYNEIRFLVKELVSAF